MCMLVWVTLRLVRCGDHVLSIYDEETIQIRQAYIVLCIDYFNILNLLLRLSYIRPTRIHLWIHLISPLHWRISAGLQTTHQFFTYSDDHPSRQSVESGRDWAREDISGPIDHFQQFWNDYRRKRVKSLCLNNWLLVHRQWNELQLQLQVFKVRPWA